MNEREIAELGDAMEEEFSIENTLIEPNPAPITIPYKGGVYSNWPEYVMFRAGNFLKNAARRIGSGIGKHNSSDALVVPVFGEMFRISTASGTNSKPVGSGSGAKSSAGSVLKEASKLVLPDVVVVSARIVI